MRRKEAIFRRFGKADVLFLTVLALVLAALLALFYVYAGREGGDVVVVTVDGAEYGRYPLAVERRVEIVDAEGEVMNVLEIRDGYADMVEADCPDRLCVSQRRISRNRENIVCLPNRVVVTVESGEDPGIDAISN